MKVDTLVRGRYVVASADPPAGDVIEDGAVAVSGGTIADVGRYDALRRGHPHAELLGSRRHLVIPGLVNSHHHGWGLSAFQLGAPDDLLEPWLIDLITRRPVDVYHDTLYAAMKLVRSGVTSVQHSGISRDFGSFERETREALRAYEASGLRVRYAVQARNRNSFAYEADEDFLRRLEPDLAADVAAAAEAMGGATEDEFEALVRELIPRYDDHPRIGVLLCAEGPEWCTDDLLRRLRSLADELGAGIHLHFLESPYQREYLRREYGRPALEQLDALGLLGPDVSLAHAVWLTEADMRLCAERGVAICHNPSSNLRLRVGIAPVATMLEHGVTVALGADSTGLNDDDDLLQEMGLAARLHQLPRGLRRGPGPEPVDILRMATSDGARAIGLPDAVGRLEPGRHADLVLLDYEEISKPFLADDVDPIAALVYRARARHVDTVIVGGTPLLAGGRFTAIDEDGVHAALAASARAPVPPRIEAWMDAVRRVRPAVEAFYSGWEEPALQPAYVPNSLT